MLVIKQLGLAKNKKKKKQRSVKTWEGRVTAWFVRDHEWDGAGTINPSEAPTDEPGRRSSSASVWPCWTASESKGDHSAAW